MLTGILLGVAIAVFVSSITFLFLNMSNLIRENLVTGAVIGTEGVTSYAIIGAIISFVTIFFFYLILKQRRKDAKADIKTT